MESPMTIVVKSNFGNYQWCGNSYGGSKSGYYLSQISKLSSKPSSQMININITINDNDLLNKIDIIEIHTMDNRLLQYTTGTISNKHTLYFAIDEKYAGSQFKVNFSKIIPLPASTRLMIRPKMDVIRQEIIDVPI